MAGVIESTSQKSIMSFTPINQIHQHLCGMHMYSHDPSRHVQAEHFCTHVSSEMHQCVIYDSDDAHAKLIGIEYIISEKLFKTLDEDEKKYWHSHKYEVESGLLQLITKPGIPAAVVDTAEKPAMSELQTTYGKTFHTWQVDRGDALPIGPPQLMMSYTGDGQIPAHLVEKRDKEFGLDTAAKREHRASYLNLNYQKLEGCDGVEVGKGFETKMEEINVKKK